VRNRSVDEGGPIAIAADHAVERDDVGGLDLFGEGHEVTVMEGGPIGEAASRCFAACERDVRTRGVDIGQPVGACLQELEADDAHATADIEHRRAVDARGLDGVDQAAGAARRS
jgi:hypothetical protein